MMFLAPLEWMGVSETMGSIVEAESSYPNGLAPGKKPDLGSGKMMKTTWRTIGKKTECEKLTTDGSLEFEGGQDGDGYEVKWGRKAVDLLLLWTL